MDFLIADICKKHLIHFAAVMKQVRSKFPYFWVTFFEAFEWKQKDQTVKTGYILYLSNQASPASLAPLEIDM